MCATSTFDAGRIPASERVHVRQVLADRDLVALALIPLVPLVVVVEDQGDDVVEAVDEPVRRSRVNEPVEPAVEVGEVVVALVDHSEKG